MPENAIVRRIMTYAFNHGVDVDEATYKVLVEIREEVGRQASTKGLFDRLFGGEDGHSPEVH